MRNIESMEIMESKEIFEEKLYDIFLADPLRTVHIIENGVLVGIIALPDFKRNQLSGQEMINRHFTKIETANEDKAVRILEEKKNFQSVPIVDEKGRVVREYYRDIDEKEQIPFVYVERVCYEALWIMGGFDKIFLLIDGLKKEEIKKLKEIAGKAENEILIKNDVRILELENDVARYKICIVDFDQKRYEVRKILYKKYDIQSYHMDTNAQTMEEIIYFRSRLYQSIAIIGDENFFKHLIAEECKVIYLDPYKCVRQKDGTYRYNEKIDYKIESVFSLIDFSAKSCMALQNNMVPWFGFFNEYDRAFGAFGGCYDIIYNLIPKFEANGINYLIIGKPPTAEMPDVVKKIGERGFLYALNRDIIDAFIGNEKITDELIDAEVFEIKKGVFQRTNYSGKYVNRINGERYTWNNPKKYRNTIYLFGPCIVTGNYVGDKDTIASYLQREVGQDYCVKNYGSVWSAVSVMIRKNQYKCQDVVIIFAYDEEVYRKNGLKVYSLLEAYKRIPNLMDHVWDNLYHCDKVVSKSIAEELYDICLKENILKEVTNLEQSGKMIKFGIEQKRIEIPWQVNEWIAAVEQYKVDDIGKTVGAIVMNCNPFTCGHRYLIEHAKEQVDILYVFVVEEDRSFFKFKDRLAMVKAGTADLQNVIVIPSGKYMISTVTLPGYFEKESRPNVEFDATDDLEIFAGAIAKAFNITIRFAGEEPTDEFTSRYNEFMSQILPSFGIRFCEIPRKSIDGKIISASLVRKYLNEKRYKEIKPLVLPIVYTYLKEYYFY